MPTRLLVLHGPNLNLISDRGRSLEALDAMLEARAVALGLELHIVQSNHQGALVDALHQHRESAQGLVVNPGSLAPHAEVLAEAIRLVGLPAVEVLLETSARKGSALKQDVELQIAGKGFEGYLQALDWLARRLGVKKAPRAVEAPNKVAVPAAARASAKVVGLRAEAPPTKTIGPSSAADKNKGAAMPAGKTIGRKSAADKPQAAAVSKSIGGKSERAVEAGLGRAAVREKIAERLSGALSPAGLATWARAQWQQVQRGAPVESGQREQLEDVLQTLLLSAATKANDHQLIELMTQLTR